jgi:hypothetical protein
MTSLITQVALDALASALDVGGVEAYYRPSGTAPTGGFAWGGGAACRIFVSEKPVEAITLERLQGPTGNRRKLFAMVPATITGTLGVGDTFTIPGPAAGFPGEAWHACKVSGSVRLVASAYWTCEMHP